MEQYPETEQPATRSYQGQGLPTVGHDVPSQDWLLLWGPLGFLVLIQMIAIVVLWRRNLKLESDCDARHEKRDAAYAQVVRETSETSRVITDKYHEHAVALRATLDAAKNRIGRRE